MVLPPATVNEAAPVGTIVNWFPAQIEPLLTATVGVVNTVTLATADVAETQPAVLEPVTK
jgi:hypothetical protein